MLRKTCIDKMIALMPSCGLDAMLICPSEELQFLAGFTPRMCERFQGLFVTAEGGIFYICNLPFC